VTSSGPSYRTFNFVRVRVETRALLFTFFCLQLHASQFRRGFCRLPYDARSSGDALVTGRFGNAHSPMARKDMEESLVSEVKGRFNHDYYGIWFNFTANNFFISEAKV
jgi:hypothetical protein